MTKRYNKLQALRGLWLRTLLPIAALCALLPACNSDSDTSVQPAYTEPTDVAVSGFKLKADSKILSGLDTVFFTIDLKQGLIFNADSLPKGTRITDLIPVITYSSHISSAVIQMEGGSKRTGEIDYKKNPNDSVDFTGDVRLTLTTSAGNYRTYTLKVNVHTCEPDSLTWGQSAVSTLPSRMAAPKEQRTVQYGDKVVSLLQESDGSYTLATTTDPSTAQWQKAQLSLPFTPRVRTLTASDGKLWILASDGTLYRSADGYAWASSGQRWYNIIGECAGTLLGISDEGGNYKIVKQGESTTLCEVPAGFPIDDFSNVYSYSSKWMSAPISIIMGGVHDTPLSSVWAWDGNAWACLNSSSLPALRGATLVPYYTFRRVGSSWNYVDYSTIFLIGGLKEDGTLNTTTYISYDNGVNWSIAPELLQMPDYINVGWQVDNTVQTQPMSAPLLPTWRSLSPKQVPSYYKVDYSIEGDNISWQCPFIYLYGGCEPTGELHNSIWRGLINRLSFVPII